MNKLIITALALVASSGAAFAQAAAPAPASSAPSVFSPSSPAGAPVAISIPANAGALLQQEATRKASVCAARGPGYVFRPNTKFGTVKADGKVSVGLGTCRAKSVTQAEMLAAGIDQGTITRILSVDKTKH
jgi:hypothetical protein